MSQQYEQARIELDAAEAMFNAASKAHEAAQAAGGDTLNQMMDSAFAWDRLTKARRNYERIVDSSVYHINSALNKLSGV